MTQAEAVFALESVSKRFGRQCVLEDVSLAIQPRECLVIQGASGSGKSVLMRLLLGFHAPDQGRVRVFGQLPPFSPYAHASSSTHRLGVLFQNDALLEDLTIEQNLVAGARAYEPQLSSEAASQRGRELIAHMGLEWERIAALKPSQLSGGMRKRAALARALACQPEALLIDEPTTGLDLASSRQIIELLSREIRGRKLTAVVITHDLECARALADRVVILSPQTRNLEEISLDELQTDGIVRQLESATSAGNTISAPARKAGVILEALGQLTRSAGRAFAPPSFADLLHRVRQTAWESLPLIGAIFLLMGMIVFVQTYTALSPVGLYNMLPDVLVEAGLKLTPPFLGLVMAGRLGSVLCAEVGLLRQTEQLDAMRVLHTPPERKILSPSLWAAVICFPLLAIFAVIMALAGGLAMLLTPAFGARLTMLKVTESVWNEVAQEMPLFTLSLVKCCLFGVIIVLAGFFFGASERRGADALGRSITGTIVVSFLAIVAMDFALSLFLL